MAHMNLGIERRLSIRLLGAVGEAVVRNRWSGRGSSIM